MVFEDAGAQKRNKRQFLILCIVFALTTLGAFVYAVRADHFRENAISSHEAFKLHELFQIELISSVSAVGEVADILRFNTIPSEQDLSRNNFRVLKKHPRLHSIGWVGGVNGGTPDRLDSLNPEAEQDLKALWSSANWLESLEVASTTGAAVASRSFRVSIDGVDQYVSVYFEPVNSAVRGAGGEIFPSGIAFGVLQVEQAFIDTVTLRTSIPAKYQLFDSLDKEKPREIAAQMPDGAVSDEHQVVSLFEWGGRSMQLRLTPTKPYLSSISSYTPWLVLLLGAVLFALMFRFYKVLQQMAISQQQELYRRELELERQQRETNALIDVAPVSILVLDAEGVIVGLSRSSISLSREQSLGRKFDELASDGIFSTLNGVPVPVQQNPILRALRGERIVNLQLICKNEERDSYFSFSASPIFDSTGNIMGSVCVNSDVTDLVQSIESQKSINAKLESSNQRLQQFASVASHDLQEPLRKITSFATLLEMEVDGKLGERPQQYLDFMVDGAKRMSVLIRDILQYSEITPGTEELEMVDLAHAIDLSKKDLSDVIAKTGANVDLIGTLPVFTSARMLPRLMTNLVSNSIKYRSEETPVIEIDAVHQDDGVLVSLSDNGQGIAEEYRDQVFNMFKRLHASSEIAGTGIGLSICKQIVELNGGRIWIEESRFGGSRFMMFFPTSAESVRAAA